MPGLQVSGGLYSTSLVVSQDKEAASPSVRGRALQNSTVRHQSSQCPPEVPHLLQAPELHPWWCEGARTRLELPT